MKITLAYVLACLATYIVASVAHSQSVLTAIVNLGVEVPLADRLRMTVGDLVGLYLYAVVIAIGLGIAFVVMALLGSVLSRAGKRRESDDPLGRSWRVSRISAWIRYPIGGALAIATILVSMKLMLSITPIAGARGAVGFACQCGAGFIGGCIFAWQIQRARAEPISHAARSGPA